MLKVRVNGVDSDRAARRTKVVLTVAAAGVSGGCAQYEAWQHPEVATCEEYIQFSLKAPTTYQRARAFISDRALPAEYWQERSAELDGKWAANPDFAQLTQRHSVEGGVRSVTVEYDAENSFGVSTRGVSNCKFEMTSFADNKFTSEPSATAAQLATLQGDETALGCCESPRVAARLTKHESKARFVSQQVIN